MFLLALFFALCVLFFIIGKQYTRNDDDVLTVTDDDRKIDCKSYHKLLNIEFVGHENSLLGKEFTLLERLGHI